MIWLYVILIIDEVVSFKKKYGDENIWKNIRFWERLLKLISLNIFFKILLYFYTLEKINYISWQKIIYRLNKTIQIKSTRQIQ